MKRNKEKNGMRSKKIKKAEQISKEKFKGYKSSGLITNFLIAINKMK